MVWRTEPEDGVQYTHFDKHHSPHLLQMTSLERGGSRNVLSARSCPTGNPYLTPST